MDFIEHRRQMKKPMTEIAIKRMVTKLNKWRALEAIECLDIAIESGWRGIFPKKKRKGQDDTVTNSPVFIRLEQWVNGFPEIEEGGSAFAFKLFKKYPQGIIEKAMNSVNNSLECHPFKMWKSCEYFFKK